MSDPTMASYYLDEYEDAVASQEALRAESADCQITRSLRLNPPASFEAWAIRHTPTGKYLPMHAPGDRNTYSQDEPEHAFPRLFLSRRSAQNALTAWLAGHWCTEIEYGYEEGYQVSSYRTEPQVETSGADLGRSKDEMEIVRFTLTLAPECVR